MQLNADHIINRLCVAGINHTCAPAEIRGLFAVDQQLQALILAQARDNGLKSVFVISTCNRTEIYGYAHHPCELAALLTQFTKGDIQTFTNHAYLHQGRPALQHLFRVACGLDSQIIGDYEIQGQLKQAYSFALSNGMIGPIMDRTVNFVFQASKKIRSSTGLSTGTVSVSFAAIEWLQLFAGNTPKNILLVGSGKFGRNVCKNIKHYLPHFSLSICNRTAAVARSLAEEVNAGFVPFEDLSRAVNNFDVILVCTNAMEAVIRKAYFTTASTQRTIIDLSVPANVEPTVAQLPDTLLVNVDEISAITKTTIEKRTREIPKAGAIIQMFEEQFYAWLQTYQHAPAIRHIKENLRLLTTAHLLTKCEMASSLNLPLIQNPEHDEHIRKAVNNLVNNLKTTKEKGCLFITAYHHFLTREAIA